jgi:hypothetical protein
VSPVTATLSCHAKERLQQRAIPLTVVDLLHRFGSSMRCGGAERLFFDKRAMWRLRQHLGNRSLKSLERWLRVYAVVGDDGLVVTVAHQSRRFRRP